ncbi:MAG: hypothetical protein AAGE59_15995 [Cyanobacteria bacterium P01_F01_bin.86]
MVQTSSSSALSSGDRLVASLMTALAMFVVGYTVTRVCFIQPQASSTDAENLVIPHEGELWRAFAE